MNPPQVYMCSPSQTLHFKDSCLKVIKSDYILILTYSPNQKFHINEINTELYN